MSEEEKDAIYELKKELRLAKNIDDITISIRNEYAEIIVDLINKQQKEIEVLREENFDTIYMKAVADFKDKIRAEIKEIEENEKGFEYSDRDVIKILEELLEE